jgi:Putative regulator of cell autolysis
MMRLSSIMVYLLHESNQPRIDISREFQLLKDYVELEKLRYSETVQINLCLEAEDENCMVVPLIFFPFVENAFKHGPRLSSSAGWISIDIKVKDDKVHMQVTNAYRELSKPENYIGGLGNRKRKKRLELHYPHNHNLEIKSHEGVFSVNLVVTLHSETEP